MAGSVTIRELLTILGVDADTSVVKEFDRAMVKTKNTSEATVGTMNRLARAVGGVVAAYLGMEAIKFVARGLIEANVSSEKLKASLETVTGSAENAAVAFGTLTDFTAETPFLLEEVAGGFIKLKALGLDPSERALASYGNTASAMGKDLNQIVEAVADASVGEFERLKEFGIKAKSEGNKVSFTFQGVTTKIGKNSEEIQEFLLGLGENQFAGAMEKQMGTLGGVISNLKGQIFLLAVEIGEAGLSDALKSVLFRLIDLISRSRQYIDVVRSGMVRATKELREGFEFVTQHAAEAKLAVAALVSVMLAAKVEGFLSQIALLIRALRSLSIAAALPAIKLALIAAAILLVILVIDDLIVFFNEGDSVTGRFLSKWEGSESLFGNIANALRMVLDTGRELVSQLLPMLMNLFETVRPIAEDLFSRLMSLGQAWLEFQVEAINKILPTIIRIVTIVAGLVGEILPDVIDFVKSLIPLWRDLSVLVFDTIAELWPVVAEFIMTIGELIKELLPVVQGMVKDALVAIAVVIVVLKPLFIQLLRSAIRGAGKAAKIIAGIASFIITEGSKGLKIAIGFVTTLVEIFIAAVDVLIKIWDFFTEMFGSIWEGISEPFIAVWEVIKTTVVGIISFLADLFNTVIDSILGVVNGLIETVNDIASEIGLGELATFSAEAIKFSVPDEPKPRISSVGDITVKVEGSTNMGPEDLSRATGDGLNEALRQANRAA